MGKEFSIIEYAENHMGIELTNVQKELLKIYESDEDIKISIPINYGIVTVLNIIDSYEEVISTK